MTQKDLPVYQEPPRRSITFQPRIIAGVLFSISKSLFGEIYPVYMGYNSIGRDRECDIRLQEETVMPAHAYIHVVRDEISGEYSASFSDSGSDNGSAINGSDARYETLSLNDGDIIDIGEHYRFIFRLFNPGILPLFENEDFVDTAEPEDFQEERKEKAEENPLNNLNKPLTVDFYAPSAKSDGNDRTVLV